MPLAPASIISAWYQRSSWCYRAYAYLRSNPLWNRPVPVGASVCVLFWEAIFSLIVFRPFVYTLLGFNAIIKGLRLGKAMEWIEDRLYDATGMTRASKGLLSLLALTALAAGYLLIIGIVMTILAYVAAGALATFLLPVIVLATLFPCAIYWAGHKHDENRCKVEVYTRIVTVLAVIAAVVLHPTYAYASFVGLPLELGGLLWFVAKAIGGGVVDGAIWVCHVLTGTVSAGWFKWALVLAALSGFYGWVLMRLADRPLPSPDQGARSRIDRKKRLMELAGLMYQRDPGSASCGWWFRFVRAFDDYLDAYLNAATWDVYDVADKVEADLFKRAAERHAVEAEAHRRRAAQCKAVTDAILRFLSPVIGILRQGRILCAYLWAFAKAKKARQCPYQRFTD